MTAMTDDVPLPEPTATPRISEAGKDEKPLKKKKSIGQKIESKMRKSMDSFKRMSVDLSVKNSTKSFNDKLRQSTSKLTSVMSTGKPPATPKTTVAMPKAAQDTFTQSPKTVSTPQEASPAMEKPAATPEKVNVTADTAASTPVKTPSSASKSAVEDPKSPAQEKTPAPTSVPQSPAAQVVSPAEAIANATDGADDVLIEEPVAEKPKRGFLGKVVRAVLVTGLVGGVAAAGVAVAGTKAPERPLSPSRVRKSPLLRR